MERKRKYIVEQETPPKIEQEEEEVKADDVPHLSPSVAAEYDRLDREYFDKMPPGYRFVPTGDELIANYLNIRKSDLNALPINRIREVNIYKYHPEKLTSVYKLHRGKEWYFFTPRTKKYPNGQRPDRAAGKGHWKATGADVPICNDQGVKIGTKKTLVFYEGKAKENNGIKTDWIMQEYRNQADILLDKKGSKDMKLDDCVLVKIYNKSSTKDGEANDVQRVENNQIIVPAENNQQLPNQNPNEDTLARQNAQLEPNPTNLFVPNQNQNMNQNIIQRPDAGNYYNRVNMARQNVQVPNPIIIQRQDGTRSYNIASNFPTQNGQVRNLNITHGLDGVPYYNRTEFPVQNVHVSNSNTNHGVDDVHLFNRTSFPVHNVQVSNSNTNQYPYGVGLGNVDSLPIQSDGLDVANNYCNPFSLHPSYYDQIQNVYERNRQYFQGNNSVNNQQVIGPDPLPIRQVQYEYQNQNFPSHVMGMDGGVSALFGGEPFDTPSQESLQGEEQTESLNCQPVFDFNDEVSLDSNDGEVGGADQVALSSKEKKN